MKKYDYLVVGVGLAGSVIAERLASQLDKKVLIIDKRDHIGGNCYDYYDKYGVLMQKYGAHLFHTKHKPVFDYLSQFTKWHKYEHRVKAWIDGEIYDLPINLKTINKFFGKDFNSKECEKFLNKICVRIKNPKNSEEQVISKVGWKIYKRFFEKYTLKQWEIHPQNLEAEVTARIPIRFNKDDRYFEDKYQFMPKYGFTEMFKIILKHENITVKLRTSYKKIKNKVKFDNLIFTGCIDEFFEYKFGKLPYRSLRFRWRNFDKPFYQDYTVINFPNNYKYTKRVEIKHATKQRINKTTIGWEYPVKEGEPYYPVPQSKNRKLYERYTKLGAKLRNTYFIGRLGQYKYFNMDQVVLEALNLFKKIKTQI